MKFHVSFIKKPFVCLFILICTGMVLFAEKKIGLLDAKYLKRDLKADVVFAAKELIFEVYKKRSLKIEKESCSGDFWDIIDQNDTYAIDTTCCIKSKCGKVIAICVIEEKKRGFFNPYNFNPYNITNMIEFEIFDINAFSFLSLIEKNASFLKKITIHGEVTAKFLNSIFGKVAGLRKLSLKECTIDSIDKIVWEKAKQLTSLEIDAVDGVMEVAKRILTSLPKMENLSVEFMDLVDTKDSNNVNIHIDGEEFFIYNTCDDKIVMLSSTDLNELLRISKASSLHLKNVGIDDLGKVHKKG